MRKYLFIAIFIVVACPFYLCSQIVDKKLRVEVDSLKRILPTLKGISRVDALNMISDRYHSYGFPSLQAEVDAETPLNQEAYALAKKLGYKQGIAYTLMNLGSTEDEKDNMGGNEIAYRQGIKYFNEAISIAKEIGDNYIIGESYGELAWLEEKRNNMGLYSDLMIKSVTALENTGKEKKGIYYDFANCNGCKGNEIWLGKLYHNFGRALIGIPGKEDSIRLLFNKAITYYKKAGDKHGEYNAYLWFRKFHYWIGDGTGAEEYTKKMILILQELGLDENLLKDYTVLCNIYWGTGNFEQGIEYAKKSVELTERLEKKIPADSVHGWFASRGIGFLWMSQFYKIGGDYETALKTAKKSKQYLPSDSISTFLFHGVIGDIYRLMGKYDSAVYFLSDFDNKPMLYPYTDGKIALRNLFLDMKQYDRVLQSIQAQDKTKQKPGGFAFTQAGAAYIGKKDYTAALENARKGLALLDKKTPIADLMNCYQMFSNIYHTVGRDDSAFYYQTKYYKLKDSIVNRQFLWRLNALKQESEEERKTSQINLLNKDNQLKEQKLKQQATVKNGLIIGIVLFFLLGIFIFRNLLLKRKNDKLQSQKDLEMQQLESEKKHAELQQQALELEMQALRAQMNPHFIFNCLSSINRFIFKNDNKAASDYLTRFSRLIRMVLMNSSRKLITLENELEMLRLYLDLERLRFKDAFDYSITTTNIVDAGAIFIPPLLLQPFCENAVWHGLMHKDNKGHLNVIISEVVSEEDKVLHCVIEDDGVGRQKAAELKSKSAENEKSMGLKITTERLALLNQENNFSTFYKIEDILNEVNAVAGTRVQLKIKYKESVEEYV